MARACRILLLLLAGLACPGAAQAGAWMREPGAVFLSFGADIDRNGMVQTLFAEAGHTARLTLGLDAWRSPFGDWSVLAVAQVPLLDRGATRAALGLGAGVTHAGGQTGPQLRLGAHLGRGLDTGWLAADLSVTHRFQDGSVSAKIAGIRGWNVTDRCAAMLEARTETSAPVTIAPSVVCRLSSRARLRIGAARAISGGGRPTVLSLQSWIEF